MPLIEYQTTNFKAESIARIGCANQIIEAYAAEGYDLTLRQLYYQFVARDLIQNVQKEYDNLGILINKARLSGLIDWNRIVDRTRNLQSLSHWSSPADIVQAAARSYRIDKWDNQEHYIEVWIEKDALVGVIADVCEELDVSYFSCRGYTSQSEMWRAAQRLMEYEDPIILHLGDHDPSGIDMTRDIQDRLNLFMGHEGMGVKVERLALNDDQVEQYKPPPNPVKLSDSRASSYMLNYGVESWELDALEPKVIGGLIEESVLALRDDKDWESACEREEEEKSQLAKLANNWDRVEKDLKQEN